MRFCVGSSESQTQTEVHHIPGQFLFKSCHSDLTNNICYMLPTQSNDVQIEVNCNQKDDPMSSQDYYSSNSYHAFHRYSIVRETRLYLSLYSNLCTCIRNLQHASKSVIKNHISLSMVGVKQQTFHHRSHHRQLHWYNQN